MTPSRSIAALLALSLAAGAAAPVLAAEPKLTPAQVIAARKSFQQGLDAERSEDWSGALTAFEATAAIKRTPQVVFHIALCEEKLGKLMAALADFETAEALAKEKKVTEVLSAAPMLAAALRERIPRLSIHLSGEAATEVLLDDVALTLPLAAEISVDPGAHVIVARAVGVPDVRVELKVAERDRRDVPIALKKPAPLAPPPEPVVLPLTPEENDSRRTIGLVVGGFGVASLGASAIFLALRASKVSDLSASCVDLKCPPSSASTLEQARTYTVFSRITLGVGIVSLGVGAYLYLSAKKPSSAPAADHARLAPWSPDGALVGLGLQGAF